MECSTYIHLEPLVVSIFIQLSLLSLEGLFECCYASQITLVDTALVNVYRPSHALTAAGIVWVAYMHGSKGLPL